MKIHYENAVFTNMLGIYGSVIHRPLGESYCDQKKSIARTRSKRCVDDTDQQQAQTVPKSVRKNLGPYRIDWSI